MRLNSNVKAYCIVVAALVIAAVFCACAAKTDTVSSPSPSASAEPTSSPAVSASPYVSPSASATPSSTADDSASPTPYELNPLWTFCNEYSTAADSVLSAISERLSAADNSEALELTLLSSSHSRALSVLMQSIGRLTYSESGVYSSTLNGSEAGSGTMSATESGYIFEFDYDNGDVLSGYFSKDCKYVWFSKSSADSGSDQLTGCIKHDETGWTSYASEYLSDTVFHVGTDGESYFAADDVQAVLSGDNISIADYSPVPNATAMPSSVPVSSATP